jgi:hypothetical protein
MWLDVACEHRLDEVFVEEASPAFMPDLHHYNGRGGRAFPLLGDRKGVAPNMPAGLLTFLSDKYGANVTAERCAS